MLHQSSDKIEFIYRLGVLTDQKRGNSASVGVAGVSPPTRNARGQWLDTGLYAYQATLSNHHTWQFYTTEHFGGEIDIENPTGILTDPTPLSATLHGEVMINNRQI